MKVEIPVEKLWGRVYGLATAVEALIRHTTCLLDRRSGLRRGVGPAERSTTMRWIGGAIHDNDEALDRRSDSTTMRWIDGAIHDNASDWRSDPRQIRAAKNRSGPKCDCESKYNSHKTGIKMNLRKYLMVTVCSAGMAVTTATPEAFSQTRAQERRIERNAQQLQRQVNRTSYYSPKAWQQIAPWARENQVVFPRAAAVGEAVKETVDAATRVGDGTFGFRDQANDNDWFYDYYSYAPTYYVPKDDTHYSGAVRYFDVDSDGVFDSQAYYRDSDNDGRYDEYDRVDFTTSIREETQLEEVEAREVPDDYYTRWAPADARRYVVEGEIAVAKAVTVNGTENLLIGVKQSGETLAIDLGPVANLKDKHVEVGNDIAAVGAMEKVGEKTVMIADSFRVEGQPRVEVERRVVLQFTGQVIDTEKVLVGDSENLMAIVEVEGTRQLVDLGTLSFNPNELEPTTKIIVWGIPINVDGHRVVLAQNVQIGGNVVRVKRF